MRIFSILWKLPIVCGMLLRSHQRPIERWYQVLTSQFVLSTIQIDQKCTVWDVSYPNTTSINVVIRSHLHRDMGDIVELPLHFDITSPIWTTSDPSYDNLWMRETTQNYILLMGTNNQTFFVLSIDPIQFEIQYKQDLLDELSLWEYNTSYKYPENTYTPLDCVE